MNNKERRTDIRIPILNEAMAWSYEGKIAETKTCKILDISKNGVFIESKEYPELGETIEIYFQLPKDLGILTLKVKVEWRRWANTKKNPLPIGFGVSIIHTDAKLEKIMDSYVIYLRNKQIIQVSKKIIEEFFLKNPESNKPIDKGPIV